MANPIKPTIKTEILPIILIIISIFASFYFYANFPETVPTHWNAAGQPDDYSSKATAAFLLPVVLIGMYLMFLFLPYIDPKKARYEQFKQVYHLFKGMLMLFLTAIYFIASFNGLGYNVSVDLWVPVLVGVLFIIIGNYMGKIKSNWFIGIRTPWTLSSENVWNKTHRLGGKLFIIGGLIMLLEPFLPVSWRLPALLITIAILAFGTMAYSYLLYRNEKEKK